MIKLKVGDVLIATNNYGHNGDKFITKGKKYTIINVTDNYPRVSEYEFICNDGTPLGGNFKNLDKDSKEYYFDVLRLERLKKLKSLL